MNERLGIYMESFHLKLGLKLGFFPYKSSKKTVLASFELCSGRTSYDWGT